MQLPLYLIGEDALVALGAARVALGVPLYLVVLWVTYRVLKASVPVGTSVMPPKPVEPRARPDDADQPATRDARAGGGLTRTSRRAQCALRTWG